MTKGGGGSAKKKKLIWSMWNQSMSQMRKRNLCAISVRNCLRLGKSSLSIMKSCVHYDSWKEVFAWSIVSLKLAIFKFARSVHAQSTLRARSVHAPKNFRKKNLPENLVNIGPEGPRCLQLKAAALRRN